MSGNMVCVNRLSAAYMLQWMLCLVGGWIDCIYCAHFYRASVRYNMTVRERGGKKGKEVCILRNPDILALAN